MKTPYALAAAIALSLTSAAFALPKPGDTIQDTARLTYVAANARMSTFVGDVSGASPRLETRVWLFFRTPETEKGEAFDTGISDVQIDCTTRTIKRTAVVVLNSAAANRVVAVEAIDEAPAAYDARSMFGAALSRVCDGGTTITTDAPSFSTLSKARAFGLAMSR